LNDLHDVITHLTEEEVAHRNATVRHRVAQHKALTGVDLPFVEASLRQPVKTNIGVVCFSGNPCSHAMWAHYAADHRGMLLEFDDGAPCFHRPTPILFQGIGELRTVAYQDDRPRLEPKTNERTYQIFCTKSCEWETERERRILWPVDHADEVAGKDDHDHQIYLYAVPSEALLSVTLGQRATSSDADEVRALLRDAPHVRMRVAETAAHTFELHYRDL
jgi:hypothetical protein